MENNTQKPIALITGSSKGIGRAIAVRLARDGFHTLIHYSKDAVGAEETFSQVQRLGGTAEVLQFDVKNCAAIESTLEKTFGQGRKISVLVNNAGIHLDGLTGLMSEESFDEVIRTNVHGPFFLMRWCVRKMIRQRSGCIVNVSSLAGQAGNPGQINYAASKAALIAMTKTLSMEVGSRGIRINAVAPGLIETEMLNGVPGIEEMIRRIPLGRLGKVEEVAGAVSFLCSNDASYITGHTISINGGLLPT